MARIVAGRRTVGFCLRDRRDVRGGQQLTQSLDFFLGFGFEGIYIDWQVSGPFLEYMLLLLRLLSFGVFVEFGLSL